MNVLISQEILTWWDFGDLTFNPALADGEEVKISHVYVNYIYIFLNGS